MRTWRVKGDADKLADIVDRALDDDFPRKQRFDLTNEILDKASRGNSRSPPL